MIALFCGSQGWLDWGTIFSELQSTWIIAQEEFHADSRADLVIHHGAAPGADMIAGIIAETMGFVVVPHPADWKLYGKAAGIIRNNEMLDLHPDRVYAFWLNSSPGTGHTINEAMRRGIPCKIHEVHQEGR